MVHSAELIIAYAPAGLREPHVLCKKNTTIYSDTDKWEKIVDANEEGMRIKAEMFTYAKWNIFSNRTDEIRYRVHLSCKACGNTEYMEHGNTGFDNEDFTGSWACCGCRCIVSMEFHSIGGRFVSSLLDTKILQLSFPSSTFSSSTPSPEIDTLRNEIEALQNKLIYLVNDLEISKNSATQISTSKLEEILENQAEIKRVIDSDHQFIRLLVKSPLGIPHIFVLIPAVDIGSQDFDMLNPLGASQFMTNHYKMFFVCPVSGLICNTNGGKGYDLHLPTEWVQNYGPAIKFSLSICIILALFGSLLLDLSNFIEPVKEEMNKALGLTELTKFLDQLNALTPTSSTTSNPDFKVARDEAYRLLTAEVMKIDPSLSRCGCKWVVSDELGEDTYATWVSPEMEDKFRREGKASLISELKEELP